MKLQIAMLASCIIFLFSCAKNQTDSNGNGYWMISNNNVDTTYTTYSVNYTGRKDSAGYFMLYGFDKLSNSSNYGINSINIFFSSIPIVSANYQVVDFRYYPILTTNQIGVISTISSKGIYVDAGVQLTNTWTRIPVDSATVTVTNGKIKVSLPRSLTSIEYPMGGVDSPSLHGVIEEK